MAVGVDLGGTKIALGVVDPSGTVLADEKIPTRADREPRAIIGEIATTVERLWGDRLPGTTPVGIGVAGQVSRGGTVLFGPNLDWHSVPLRASLASALDRPVTVVNDVQAATVAEWRYGAGRDSDDVVCLFVGTGIGGGIVADGRLRHGAHGTAGELGHTTVQRDGRKCHCPNAGCLEAYAGGWAIAERAREAVSADQRRGARLVELAGEVDQITSETVERAYHLGDPLAVELVGETFRYLEAGLVSIVNALDPERIVLGGGVIAGYPTLIAPLERAVRNRALAAATEGLRILPARLGPVSGLVGAAAFAREKPGR